MVIVENLCCLEQLPPDGFQFCAFPLKIRDADGSPVRAAAAVP
jgi:kynurenine formamidase